MEFTDKEKREIDEMLARAGEDMKNGRYHTGKEGGEFLKECIRRMEYIYNNQIR